jgi:hypothetical protein
MTSNQRRIECAYGTNCINKKCSEFHVVNIKNMCEAGNCCDDPKCRCVHQVGFYILPYNVMRQLDIYTKQKRAPCIKGTNCLQKECPGYHFLMLTDICDDDCDCLEQNCRKLHVKDNGPFLCKKGNYCDNGRCKLSHPNEYERRKRTVCFLDKKCDDVTNCVLLHSQKSCLIGNECKNRKCKDVHPNEKIRRTNVCDGDKDCEVEGCRLSHTPYHSDEYKLSHTPCKSEDALTKAGCICM